MLVFGQLKALKRPNLTVGIHSVISRFNVDHFPELHEYVTERLQPDSFISEIAEERVELGTIGTGITPRSAEYARAVDIMRQASEYAPHHGQSRYIQAFRRKYYELVKRLLTSEGQMVPCYAGWASCHVAPNGDVWTCAVRAEPIANLRDVDYDFRKIWFSRLARPIRRSIRAQECACPLANAAYTSMLMDPRTMIEVGTNLWQEVKKERKDARVPGAAGAVRRN
jgi:MoaA/NifB/PqqE/SkfB family radical SAM enzyme